MTKTLSLLLASAALTAVIGVPAWSAMHTPSQGEAVTPLAAVFGGTDASSLLVLIDDDEDEDGAVKRARSEEDEAEDCDDDEGSCGGTAANAPAPAGSVPPPQNGLFGTGTPQVKVK